MRWVDTTFIMTGVLDALFVIHGFQLDTMRQFTLAFDQRAALRHYFEHHRRNEMVLRETAVTETPPS